MGDEDLKIREPMKWHFSMAFGVMYGPYPVGIIVVVLLGIVYLVAGN